MKRAGPDIATLTRVAAKLREDAVATPWPEREPGACLPELVRRLRPTVGHNDGAIEQLCAKVRSLCGEDDQELLASSLDELIAQLELVLGKREEARRTSIRGPLDVLRMTWGDAFEIGWDGIWWYRRRDGLGQIVTAPTPEELARLMAQDFAGRPVRLTDADDPPGSGVRGDGTL